MTKIRPGRVVAKKDKIYFTNSVDWGGYFVPSNSKDPTRNRKLKPNILSILSTYNATAGAVTDFKFYSLKHRKKVLFEFFGINQLYALRDLLNKVIEDIEMITDDNS